MRERERERGGGGLKFFSIKSMFETVRNSEGRRTVSSTLLRNL